VFEREITKKTLGKNFLIDMEMKNKRTFPKDDFSLIF